MKGKPIRIISLSLLIIWNLFFLSLAIWRVQQANDYQKEAEAMAIEAMRATEDAQRQKAIAKIELAKSMEAQKIASEKMDLLKECMK